MTHPAVEDLRERLALGLARGASLLVEEEREIVARLMALPGEEALLLARLAARTTRCWRLDELEAAGVEDLPTAVRALRDAGLVDGDVPWPERAAAARVAVLRAGCARLGLPVGGARPALVARLVGREGWDDGAWIRLTHAPLVLRLERWALLDPWPDRTSAVLERLGVRAFVDHPVTGGGLVASRQAWALWEVLVDAPSLAPELALAGLAWGPWPPGALDRRRALKEIVREAARQAERLGHLEEARRLWEGLARVVTLAPDDTLRLARVVERQGAGAQALHLLTEGAEQAHAGGRASLQRAARRVARSMRTALPPDPPGPPVVLRTLRLDRVGRQGPRPTYEGGLVEAAVAQRLAEAGRTVLAGERAPWDALFARILADAAFLPVPGQLPAPRLSGPLDLGTPAFAARRPEAVFTLLDTVDAGRAGELVRDADRRYAGKVVAGFHPDDPDTETLVRLAEAAGPRGLRALLLPLLRQGRRALRGLPDLVVLPGPVVTVDGLHRSRVDEGLLLVEVKGEGDTLRDDQAAWLATLTGAGLAAEVWRVVAAPYAAPSPRTN